MSSADGNAAFADALKRAKEIAARMGTGPTGRINQAAKRGLDDQSENDASKKPKTDAMSKSGDDIVIDAKAIAMQVAANIAQRAGLGPMPVEELQIPNKFVGLIIGKGGEQITKLQSETGAKIQVAPDPPPNLQPPPDRLVTITGNPEAVEKAKNIVKKICEEGKVPDSMMSVPALAPGETALEVMIPAPKVGLIIGKGGETIKNLQERAQCRMVMIQDGSFLNAPEKPLRITGELSRCQRGKDLVMDLLTEKELEQMQQKGDFMGRHTNEYGTPMGGQRFGGASNEIPVPKESVGFIIGKNGETIKRLQMDTGARIQFKPLDNNPNLPTRLAMISGSPDEVRRASQLINEIVDQSRQRGHRDGPRGRDGPRDNGPSGPGVKKLEIPVPSAKCGRVIGKGGDMIRQIMQQSGAYVELNRAQVDNGPNRIFVVRGTDSQIQHAESMILEKCSDGPNHGGHYNQGQNYHQHPSQQHGWNNYQQQGGYNSQYGQNNYGQQQGQVGDQQRGQGPPSTGAPSSGTVATSGGQPDYTAAWAAYYQQIYQQQAAGGAGGTGGAAAGGQSQPDYSAQWMEYYRQQGYYYPYGQQQAGQQQAGQQSGQPPQQPGQQPAQQPQPGQQPQPAQQPDGHVGPPGVPQGPPGVPQGPPGVPQAQPQGHRR